jgi:flavorubredoxin
MIDLFDADGHKNVMFYDLSGSKMVQSNQHVIVDGSESIILDPGGHKIYTDLLINMSKNTTPGDIKYIFFSHQDPDVLAAANGWLMISDAVAYISEAWIRFLPHFGIDDYMVKRVKGIPDEGMEFTLNNKQLKVIPAHFLHSPGNFHLYDPTSKILYTGDLGASLGQKYYRVEDFDSHIQYMEPFHKRYMSSSKAIKTWAATIRNLDIEIIAPQHGAIFPDRTMVKKFIDWVTTIDCGLDLMPIPVQPPPEDIPL